MMEVSVMFDYVTCVFWFWDFSLYSDSRICRFQKNLGDLLLSDLTMKMTT